MFLDFRHKLKTVRGLRDDMLDVSRTSIHPSRYRYHNFTDKNHKMLHNQTSSMTYHNNVKQQNKAELVESVQRKEKFLPSERAR